jgi:hypothetical protein
VVQELEQYLPMAKELGLSGDVLRQAAQLGVRDGIFRHRESEACRYREEECVLWNIRHFIDLTLVRAALLASSDDEMQKAEYILMKLIEE